MIGSGHNVVLSFWPCVTKVTGGCRNFFSQTNISSVQKILTIMFFFFFKPNNETLASNTDLLLTGNSCFLNLQMPDNQPCNPPTKQPTSMILCQSVNHIGTKNAYLAET